MNDKGQAALLKRLKNNPDRLVDLIVTVDGDPHEYESRCRALALDVKRTFALTRKLALRGTGRSFLALSNESWVSKLEEDTPVRTMD